MSSLHPIPAASMLPYMRLGQAPEHCQVFRTAGSRLALMNVKITAGLGVQMSTAINEQGLLARPITHIEALYW